MELKKWVILIIILPLLISFLIWTLKVIINPTEENLEGGVKLIEKAVIPWWINIFNFLGNLGGIIAVILIILFIIFLKWISEIK